MGEEKDIESVKIKKKNEQKEERNSWREEERGMYGMGDEEEERELWRK